MGRKNSREQGIVPQAADAAGLAPGSEALQTHTEASDLPVFALDRELRYTAFNRAHADVMRALYGVEIALGGRLADYQSVAADRETAQANLERTLAGEHVVVSAFSGEPGRERCFDVVHDPQTDAAGNVVGVEVHAYDVTERPRVEAALRTRVRELAAIYANVRDVVFHLAVEPDDRFRFVLVNPAFLEVTGLTEDQVVGKLFQEVIPEPAHALVLANYKEAVRTGKAVSWEGVSDYPAGRKHGEASVAPIYGADGTCTHLVGVVHDITERKRAEEALRLTQLSVDRAADLIHWIAPDGHLLYVSDSVCRRHGCSREQMLKKSVFDLDPTMSPERWARHWQVLKEQGSVTLETVHRTGSGEEFPVEVTANFVEQEGEEYNFAFARDISERKRVEQALLLAKEQTEAANRELASHAAALEEANAAITRLAATDDLTSLATRRHFYESLEKAVSLARRHGSPLAVASFDLDGLKRVNDSAGHRAGDEVLTRFAALLGSLCRAEDLPGRLGGDEFSVLLPGIELSGALKLAERVLAAVRSHEVLRKRGVTVSGGIVAWAPDELPDDLLRRADDALYAAKRGGGDSVAVDG